MSPWELPTSAVIGGQEYPIHADYRDILEIMAYLDDPDKPEFLRWRIAVALFYEGEIPREVYPEAMEYLARFISQGEPGGRSGPRLLDWSQDALAIVSDVNRVAGREIRDEVFVHWWTFLSWFHAIGEGQLSTLVSIRDKLRRGKKLEKWEQDFYREHREQVELKKRFSARELEEQRRLNELLGE